MATLVDWSSGPFAGAGASAVGTVTEVNRGAFYEVLANSSNGYLRWTLAAQSVYTIRAYVRVPEEPTDVFMSFLFARRSSGAVDAARFGFTGSLTPGACRWQATGSALVGETVRRAVTAGSVYRVEMQVDSVAGAIRGAIFRLGATLPLYDTGLQSVTSPTGIDRLLIGAVSSSMTPINFGVSRVLMVNTVGSWLGRHSSDPSTGDEVIRWDTSTLAASGATILGDCTEDVLADWRELVVPAGDTDGDYAEWATPELDRYAISFYCRYPSTAPALNVAVMRTLLTSASQVWASISGGFQPGQVRWGVASELDRTATNLIETPDLIRIEMQVDVVSSTVRGAVFFAGADIPAYETELHTVAGLTAINRVRIGRVGAVNTAELRFSRLVVRSGVGAWIGRHPSDDPPTPGAVNVWRTGVRIPCDILGILDDTGTLADVERLGMWNGANVDAIN